MQTKLLLIMIMLGLIACSSTTPAGRDTIPRQLAEDMANGQITLDIPSGFPPFDLPDSVEVAGGLDRGFSTQVIVRSELTPDALQQVLEASFLENGWVALEDFPSRPPRGGFVSTNSPTLPGLPRRQLCHDRYGILSFSPRATEGIYNRLSLDWSRSNIGPGQQTCEQQNEQRRGQGFFRNPQQGLDQYMPILELPSADRGSRFQPFGAGMSGSGDALTTRTPLVIDWALNDIIDWFSGQLEEQGWKRDATWEGESSAGSSWTSVTNEGKPLAGLLDVFAEGDEVYQLRFRVSFLGNAR